VENTKNDKTNQESKLQRKQQKPPTKRIRNNKHASMQKTQQTKELV